MKKRTNKAAEPYHSDIIDEFISLGTPEEYAETEKRMMQELAHSEPHMPQKKESYIIIGADNCGFLVITGDDGLPLQFETEEAAEKHCKQWPEISFKILNRTA